MAMCGASLPCQTSRPIELVERCFELGKRVVSSPNPIAIFLAGCRECLTEGEIQAARRVTIEQRLGFCPRGPNREGDTTVRKPLLPTWAKPRRRPLKHPGWRPSRVKVGQASRRRIRAGGPLALGRSSASGEAWREIRAQIVARAHWNCQVPGLPTDRRESSLPKLRARSRG